MGNRKSVVGITPSAMIEWWRPLHSRWKGPAHLLYVHLFTDMFHLRTDLMFHLFTDCMWLCITNQKFDHHFQSLVLSQFLIEPKDSTFVSFFSCSDAILNFIQDRDNWGSPFLPQPPSCPPLLHEGDRLELEEEKWHCT